MKTILTLLALTLLALPIAAMSHGDHSGNGQESMKLGMAKLGPFKKSEYWSRRKHFKVKAPLVPISRGMAEFKVTVVGRDNVPATEVKLTDAALFMPGKKLNLPKVQVDQTDQEGQFLLRFPVTEAGYWKLKLTLNLGGVSDQATIKFIVK